MTAAGLAAAATNVAVSNRGGSAVDGAGESVDVHAATRTTTESSQVVAVRRRRLLVLESGLIHAS